LTLIFLGSGLRS